MLENNLDSTEIMLFFDDSKVVKEMMYTEFEAILDGVVGLDDFAGRQLNCIFTAINSRLAPTALCCFTLSFDKGGQIPSHWNLPLRSLSQDAPLGPDLGAGPAHLATSATAVPADYRDELWQPSEQDLQEMTKVILRNRLCIATERLNTGGSGNFEPGQTQTHGQPQYPVYPFIIPTNNPGNAPMQPQGQYPGYGYPASTVPPYYSYMQPPGREHGPGHESMPPVLPPEPAQDSHAGQNDPASSHTEPSDLSELSQPDIDFDASTNGKQSNSALGDLLLQVDEKYQHKIRDLVAEERKTQIEFRKQIEKSLHKYKQALRDERKEKNQLQQKVAMLSAQVDLLKDQHREDEMKYGELRDRFDLASHEINQEEYQHKLKALSSANEKIKSMGEELTHLRRDARRLYDGGADNFFEKLESAGLSFIAFHPGAGHVSVKTSDMAEYLENPFKFAAAKCNISLEAYKVWLDHYEDPKCRARLMGNDVCGNHVKRIEHPSDFKSGISDRCDKHQTGFSAAATITLSKPSKPF